MDSRGADDRDGIDARQSLEFERTFSKKDGVANERYDDRCGSCKERASRLPSRAKFGEGVQATPCESTGASAIKLLVHDDAKASATSLSLLTTTPQS